MVAAQAEIALEILKCRDGQLTIVELTDGQRLRVLNIAWGRDIADSVDHVTTNISPGCDGFPIDFFFMSELRRLADGQNGAILFEA